MGVEIPLFPLSTVLFPHMPLPLHIFEERYRVMLRDCEEQGITFGVVAIREGVEVGGPAEPHRVGTLAQLRKVERLEDGRYNVLAVGASRFRVLATSHERPYLVGEVEYLEDQPVRSTAAGSMAGRVAGAYREYADRLRRLADRPVSELSLPDDPELLSYLVAGTLQVEIARKQELLEMDGTEERLQGCLSLLRREAVLLEQMLARRESPLKTFSPN
jgi:Lon protease-like protein